MPTRVTLDLGAVLREVLGEPVTVVKDLMEHERVCTTCKGLSLVKSDQPFGIRGEPPKDGDYYPYHKQWIKHCHACYDGVQRLCEFCSEPLLRGYTSGEAWCNCDAASKARHQAEDKKEAERQAKAKRVPIAEYNGEMLFDVTSEHFVSATDWEDGGFYYACYEVKDWIAPAADTLIEQLDDAGVSEWDEFEGVDVSKEAVAELQTLLEGWFEKSVKLNPLYYPDYDTIVVVPERQEEEDADEDRADHPG